MAEKITDLTAITSADSADILPIVDTSDTTQASSGSTRKITKANLTKIDGGTDGNLLQIGSSEEIEDSGILASDVLTGTTGNDYEDAAWDDGKLVSYNSLVGTGNGTTDDTAALNAFLTANAGGTVKIPAGDYKITSTVAVPADTTVYAYGARIFNTTSDIYLMTMDSGSKLLGLELEGVDDTYNSGGRGISIVGADKDNYKSNIIIRDCYIHDIGFYGIYNEFVSKITVDNTRLESIGYGGYMGLSVTNVKLINNYVNDIPGNGTNAYGLAVTRQANTSDTTTYPFSSDIIISNNKIENISLWVGISAHSGVNMTISGNIIKNCKMAIRLGGGTGTGSVSFGASQRCSIVGNTIYGLSTGNAIQVNGTTERKGTGNVVVGNTIYEGGIDDDDTNGAIFINYTETTTVSGNTLYRPYSNGIAFYTRNEGFSCTGNTVIDVQATTDTTPSCVAITGEYNKGVITGNSFNRDETSINNYVSVVGIKFDSTATNPVKIGQNYSDCSTNISGFLANMLFQDDMQTKCKASLSVGQDNITDDTDVKVLLNTELYDVGDNFDTSNNRFVAPVDGYYLIIGKVHWKALVDNKRYGAVIYVDGAAVETSYALGNSGASRISCYATTIVHVDAGEYIELYARHTSGVSTPDIEGGSTDETNLTIHLLSI